MVRTEHGSAPRPTGEYVPPGLEELVSQIEHWPGWRVWLGFEYAEDGAGGLKLFIVSQTVNSFDFSSRIRVRHEFLVPTTERASESRSQW